MFIVHRFQRSHLVVKLVLFDLKRSVRILLRRLCTDDLASNFLWRKFRGNFQIRNLKIVKIIFGKDFIIRNLLPNHILKKYHPLNIYIYNYI